MKKILSLSACLCFVALLGGCAVYTPSGAVVVDPGVVHVPGPGGFCPPGQAKKGNC